MLVIVHVSVRNQCAVFQAKTFQLMGAGIQPFFLCTLGNQFAQRWITGALVGHVLNKVRELITGIHALEPRRTVNVVAGIDQPVHVKHHQGVGATFTRSPTDLAMTIDSGLPTALVRARQF